MISCSNNYETENFGCVSSLMDDVLDTLRYINRSNHGGCSSVAIICMKDLAESILKHMCVLFAVNELDLHIDYIDYDKLDYNDSLGVVLVIEDGELHLSIETTKSNNGYKNFDMDYLYVDNGINNYFLDCQSLCRYKIDIFKS